MLLIVLPLPSRKKHLKPKRQMKRRTVRMLAAASGFRCALRRKSQDFSTIKNFFFLITALTFSAATMAQTGTTSKANMVSLSFEMMTTKWERGAGMGTAHGISAGYMRTSRVCTKAGLDLNYGGKLSWLYDLDKKDPAHLNQTYRTTYLHISLPVNLSKDIAFGVSGVTFTPFIGPNFKFNLLGKYKYTWQSSEGLKTEQINYLSRTNRYPGKIFQFGMNIGLGFTFKDVYLGYTFQPDFTKYIDSGEDYYHQSVCKTTSHSITLGYRF